MKFVEVGNLYTGFHLCQEPLSSDKEHKNENIIFEYDVKTSKLSCDTRPWVVINRAKFHHPRFDSFEGVKTQTHTHSQN